MNAYYTQKQCDTCWLATQQTNLWIPTEIISYKENPTETNREIHRNVTKRKQVVGRLHFTSVSGVWILVYSVIKSCPSQSMFKQFTKLFTFFQVWDICRSQSHMPKSIWFHQLTLTWHSSQIDYFWLVLLNIFTWNTNGTELFGQHSTL